MRLVTLDRAVLSMAGEALVLKKDIIGIRKSRLTFPSAAISSPSPCTASPLSGDLPVNTRGDSFMFMCILQPQVDPGCQHMHIRRILMHMRTTLIINERLLEHARELTGI